MAEGGGRVFQEAQGDEARQELLLGELVARCEAGMLDEGQRLARIAARQGVAGMQVQLGPPAPRMVAHHRGGGHAQENGMGLLVASGHAQGVRPIEQQARVQTVGDLVQRALRLGQAASDQRDPGIGNVGGLPLHPRGGAPGGGDLAAPEQIVHPGAIAFGRQKRPVFLHDGQFDGEIKAAFGPALTDQRCAAGLFAGLHQRLAQPDLADGGIGRLGAEPGDQRGGGHVRRDGGLGARLQGAAQRPGPGAGRGSGVFDHRVDLGEGRAAVLVQGIAPFQQPPGGCVLALCRQGARAHPVALGRSLEGAHEQVMLRSGQKTEPAGPCPRNAGTGGAAIRDGLHHHHIAVAAEPGWQGLGKGGAPGDQGGAKQRGTQDGHGHYFRVRLVEKRGSA